MNGEDYVRTVVVEKGVKTLDVTESKEMSEINEKMSKSFRKAMFKLYGLKEPDNERKA